MTRELQLGVARCETVHGGPTNLVHPPPKRAPNNITKPPMKDIAQPTPSTLAAVLDKSDDVIAPRMTPLTKNTYGDTTEKERNVSKQHLSLYVNHR